MGGWDGEAFDNDRDEANEELRYLQQIHVNKQAAEHAGRGLTGKVHAGDKICGSAAQGLRRAAGQPIPAWIPTLLLMNGGFGTAV